MKLKGVRLIIFDLDDTLLDNREVDYQSFAVICRRNQLSVPSRRILDSYRNQGMRADEIIRTVCRSGSRSVIELVKRERQELLASGDLWLRLVRPFPGVIDLLAKLKKKRVCVAVITIRKNRRLIEQLLKKRDWQQHIDFLFCGDDLPDPGGAKTHASDALRLKKTGYMMAMKKFGVEKSKILVIGDDPNDLQAAFDLRIACMRVRNSYKESLFHVTTNTVPVIESITDLRITN